MEILACNFLDLFSNPICVSYEIWIMVFMGVFELYMS